MASSLYSTVPHNSHKHKTSAKLLINNHSHFLHQYCQASIVQWSFFAPTEKGMESSQL